MPKLQIDRQSAPRNATQAPERSGDAQLLAPLPPPPAWALTQRCASFAALVVLAPVFAVLWAAVRLTSNGPFLTRQQREGFLGVPFCLLKIRTVRLPEPYANVRQTPLGTFLRASKLDELPQLWNVVKGDLLWVGPRPMPISVATRFANEHPSYAERLRVMPGLTNIGSVSSIYDESNAHSEPDFERLIEADLHYLRHRSVGYDVASLFLTALFITRRALRAVFRSRRGGIARSPMETDKVSYDLQTWLASNEVTLQPRQSSRAWRLAQRGLALSGMVAAFPVFAAMYVGVKLSSPGPFLFQQRRRGFLGQPFTIYKVRTMSLGSETRTALGVQNNDPSVTRIGRVLRALKLDELPQLFNVVRGDMEIVGPRPIPVALENRLLEEIPGFGMRHLVRPGLTNVSQVSVVDNELDDRLIADWTLRAEGERHYVANKSLGYDLAMIPLTVLYIGRKLVRRGDKEEEFGGAASATTVLGTPVANLNYDGVIAKMQTWIDAGNPHRYVCLCPVHSIVEARINPSHKESVQQADINAADGMPIVWAQKVMGSSKASRVYGPTLMLKALEAAAKSNWRVGLLGGHPERLDTLKSHLTERFPGLNIAFQESPPFRKPTETEDAELVERLNDAKLDLVWVGLGCPKQERWMLEHRERVHGVLLGVGAAFDFHCGMLKQAPRWMQVAGLEWFFRLCCEPRRLFKRYATTNPAFMSLFGLQVLGRVILRKRYRHPLAERSPVSIDTSPAGTASARG